MEQDNLLFKDRFTITGDDTGKTTFERVRRVYGRSLDLEMDLTLDYNKELYNGLEIGQGYTLTLASSLDPNVDEEATKTSWRERAPGTRDLSDEYEYVMYGKVYKYGEDRKSTGKLAIYISFGGLLMKLEGDSRHLQKISLGQSLYLLIR